MTSAYQRVGPHALCAYQIAAPAIRRIRFNRFVADISTAYPCTEGEPGPHS
jgi:hypothetical protein